MVVGLSVAVPPDVVPAGGEFPLSWLTRGLTMSRALAAVTGLPAQERQDPGNGGYVPSSATMANGGAGRAPRKATGGLDGFQPHDASTKTVVTDPTREGFDADTSRRQPGSSKATMDQYANADGSVTRVYSAGRANYRAEDGSWQTIDPDLVRSGDRWKMRANSLDVSLGRVSRPSKPTPIRLGHPLPPRPRTAPIPIRWCRWRCRRASRSVTTCTAPPR
ncbi:hypothetical protein [Actinoplanes sp. CA-252034]|uniref:hypothetical protein n=1 Tax=Actinoplanes sp. CA-252034 TaxID=3239906 RepID=UPI003D96B397